MPFFSGRGTAPKPCTDILLIDTPEIETPLASKKDLSREYIPD